MLNNITQFDDFQNQNYFDKHILQEGVSYPRVRSSKDSHVFMLLDTCKNNNLFILNGRCGTDRNIEIFTFRDRSVIDYVIATVGCRL